MIEAPCSIAAAAMRALAVSMQIGATTAALRAPTTEATPERSSSHAGGAAPGRLRSPPIFRIVAPSARRRCPCSTTAANAFAAGTVESELGATPRAPMTGIGELSASVLPWGRGKGEFSMTDHDTEVVLLHIPGNRWKVK